MHDISKQALFYANDIKYLSRIEKNCDMRYMSKNFDMRYMSKN